jgi:DNA repair protein RecO (recombination protein O)
MARARVIRTETIVLRQQHFGEADRLLTLLTPECGKLRAIAKGVRRPSSRKAGHLDLFMRTDVLLALGRNLDIITQAQTLDPYRALREDLLRSSYASYCVELLDCFTPDGEANHELYRLLANTLSRLNTSDNLALTARHYELQLLDLVGFRPELERCLGKGEQIKPEDQHFDALAGGVLCSSCGSQRRGARPISVDALRLMRFLQRSPYAAVQQLRVRPKVAAELERTQLRYITVQLEKQLKSVDFLERVRHFGLSAAWAGGGAPVLVRAAAPNRQPAPVAE